ncbi:uncharacterized protein Z520_07476 [Fonsecaea multimorphosa CBS 102226]|uniref:Uncharacterized protein n=1 Tax=Fonsecaea multimorphosa CBS 102226 TaxID=1442371 RepID=A0A0D2II93_9EURO|nr:uncharacterized protein Z520_07476 [Fonsecaea multimorphosa CBS 102226]KIX96756.1 hypothetical protein Z520_07476 [Fonsecaea multimorphosa CBS 102226]OAL22436.1 hypothetical protein AYO22_06994 [Fonsecaea multimorphosa]
MDEEIRPFETVTIGLATVETGAERFMREGVPCPPPLAYWRNNLTALSQRFNLYFVATRETIAVYRPEFPFQKLHRLPALLIIPALANPDAAGYIDPQFPHTINHLIVGDLGNEEILLIATDSGNISAYYTKSIQEAIRKDPYRFSTDARSDCVGLWPFFEQWVYESAWGLAIHTSARLIAVSANTPHHVADDDPCAKITVFAFALTNTGDEGGDDEHQLSDDDHEISEHAKQSDWQEWLAIGVDATAPPRNKNYKITLAGIEGHDQNIPCISFVNTDDDLEGNWLLSTDIDGDMKIWQIWQGICQRSWDFSEKTMRPGPYRRREGGWLVAALDSHAFRSARTMEQFCGYYKVPQYHGHNALESYDLTNVVRLRTPSNSVTHFLMYEGIEDDDNNEEVRELSDSWSDMDEATVDTDQAEANAGWFPDYGEDTNDGFLEEDSEISREPEGVRESGTSEVASVSGSNPRAHNTGDQSTTPQRDLLSLEHGRFEESDAHSDESEESEDDELQYPSSSEEVDDADLSSSSRRSTTSLSSLVHRNSQEINVDVLSASDMDSPSRRRQRIEPKSPKPLVESSASNVAKPRARAKPPNIPTLHCTTSNLRLIMTPAADSPHVFCANILRQALPRSIQLTTHIHLDRLNMMLQIPELGIVVVAAQVGRCAVCSLTKNETTGTLGLRVSWVLPTRKQELLKRIRPFSPLLGIAASPVQGCFKPNEYKDRSGSTESTEWGKDGLVDGVPTTFDPTVLVVNGPKGEGDGSQFLHMNAESSERADGPRTKRKRLSHSINKEQSARMRTEIREWEVPPKPEPWQALENSRRYRLMLTYMDMTVLSYELSRGVEREDIAYEVSALDMLD